MRNITRFSRIPDSSFGIHPLQIEGMPVDMDTAHQLAKTVPFKFQDWAISLIDGLASNPQKVGDDGIDIFGVFLNKPDNMDRKAIIVQVTGAFLKADELAHHKVRSGWQITEKGVSIIQNK